jgi:hypothetical protein
MKRAGIGLGWRLLLESGTLIRIEKRGLDLILSSLPPY